ncbi:MAG: glycosyl transferase family 1 [Mesonia hippocampi]|uniref:glycosyl transferase family 1 n=1 Tax=Mesonia hippocampi TaxID=1628250 RepID=UPI003F9A79F7
METRVLIVAYYWPPAGGPGVQRWLNFVKYLPQNGIKPVVFVPENANYPIIDKSFEQEIPDGVEVLKFPIFEPYQWASFLGKKETNSISSGIIEKEENQTFTQKLMLYIRGNYFIPDARIFWVKPAVKYLTDFLAKNKDIKTLITTGPPHSLHLIGLKLKQQNEMNWVADFRDPWTTIGYHKKLKLTERAHKKHLHLEQEVLDKASLILTTSYTTKQEFSEKTTTPIQVITNGFEPKEVLEKPLDKNFTLAHIGSLLSDRNPLILWEVLQELLQENTEFKKHFKLRFIGKVSKEVLTSLATYHLTDFVENLGYLPHQEAVLFQNTSQVLLLIEIDSVETRGIIPGKLFEYLNTSRPIIAIGPEKWDVNQVMKAVGAESCFTYQDKTALKDSIAAYFKAYQEANLKATDRFTKNFTRKALTKQLAIALKQLPNG